MFLGYFEQKTLKRNLTLFESCFIFQLFHKHLLSPELPYAACLLKTLCFEKVTAFVIETTLLMLLLVQMNKAQREVSEQINRKSG